MILKCHCKHEYQDKRYGKYQRVHAKCGKADARYRCTVCGSEQTIRVFPTVAR